MLGSTLRMLVFHFQRNAPWLSLVLPMLFILRPIMLEVHCSSSSPRDLVVQQHLRMRPVKEGLQVLFLEECRSFHIALNQLEETMDIQTISDAMSRAPIQPRRKDMDSHTLKVRHHNKPPLQCITEVPLQRGMVVLDHSSLLKPATQRLYHMLDLLSNQCKVLSQASH